MYPYVAEGKIHRYRAGFNYNNTFLKDKLSVNFFIGGSYSNFDDFNKVNNLSIENYYNYFVNTNISYSNFLMKGLNVNFYAFFRDRMKWSNTTYDSFFYHYLEFSKNFENAGLDIKLSFESPFYTSSFTQTITNTTGLFTSDSPSYRSVTLGIVKRFGNQKAKESNRQIDKERISSGQSKQ